MKKTVSLILLMALMPAVLAEGADAVVYGRIYTSNEAQLKSTALSTFRRK